jgi:nucleotide-binding universal stress UspA family protein
MIMQILFATDGSDSAAHARDFLQALPLPAGARIHLLCVIDDPAAPAPFGEGAMATWQVLAQMRVAAREWAGETLRKDAGTLAAAAEITTEVRDGDPAREIIAAAGEVGADLVALGATGATGLAGLLLGSVARNVAKHCARPVLLARAPRSGIRRVVLATDGSERAGHAAAFAGRLPLPPAAEITVVHVVRPYQPFAGLFPTDRQEFDAAVLEVRREQRAAAEALVSSAAGLLPEGKRAVTAVREGDPAAEILSLAGEIQADLIIAGARGASLIEGLVVGSVADRLLKEAPCSILIIH